MKKKNGHVKAVTGARNMRLPEEDGLSLVAVELWRGSRDSGARLIRK